MSQGGGKEGRLKRLGASLRENLKRRRAQARARRDGDDADDSSTDSGDASDNDGGSSDGGGDGGGGD